MRRNQSLRFLGSGVLTMAMGLSLTQLLVAQPAGSNPKSGTSNNASPRLNAEDVETTREELFKLLRISPKLTAVIARDPSLLGDEPYIARNNPELEQFLQAHAEIVRSPEFYLFTGPSDGRNFNREFRLQEEVWPNLNERQRPQVSSGPIAAFLVFLSILLSLLWLIRVLLENRRWTRIFSQQSAAQNKLFDRFGSSEELLRYVQSDAGKRLLEPMAIPPGFASETQWNTPLARVLTPLQFGLVLTLVGSGFLLLAGRGIADTDAMTTIGTLILMLGVGLVISAAVAWGIGKHFGLLPARSSTLLEDDSSASPR